MASRRLLACVIFSLISIVCANVPVLLWESSKSDRTMSIPAFHRISTQEFQQYILKKSHGVSCAPLIVIFAGQSLSMEDFRQDSQGKGHFSQLKYITENAANVEFLPSVLNPLEAIKSLTEFGYSLHNIDSDKTGLPDGCGNGKILMVNLEEARLDDDRPELLSRHDDKITSTYSELLAHYSHVIGILTGQHSSWVEPEELSRLRRSAEDMSNTSTSVSGPYTLYQDTKGFSLLYSTSLPMLTYDGKEIGLGNYSVVISGDNSKASEIKLFAKYGTDYRLSFNFDKLSGYWYLRTVDLQVGNNPEIVLKGSLDIVAPLDMSYHSNKVSFRNGSTTLTFSDLQVQPFFLKPGTKSFSDAIDSVEFFTPAIWSGIFVTFLLALIFTWGLSMIMDIRTMDQFDDPKGKTITVSATD